MVLRMPGLAPPLHTALQLLLVCAAATVAAATEGRGPANCTRCTLSLEPQRVNLLEKLSGDSPDAGREAILHAPLSVFYTRESIQIYTLWTLVRVSITDFTAAIRLRVGDSPDAGSDLYLGARAAVIYLPVRATDLQGDWENDYSAKVHARIRPHHSRKSTVFCSVNRLIIPDPLACSAPLVLKRWCDRTPRQGRHPRVLPHPAAGGAQRAHHGSGRPGAVALGLAFPTVGFVWHFCMGVEGD